jgi:hypothetical protein
MTAGATGYLQGPMAAHASNLQTTFKRVARRHNQVSGSRREDTLREFLSKTLPKRLAVATGEVAASDGQLSPQIDIIIFDALDTPLLDRSESSVVVPVEGVYAVIEVASTLDGAKLQTDAAKIRAVKGMPKTAYPAGIERFGHGFDFYGRQFTHFPVFGFCFGYESAPLATLMTALGGLDRSPLSENVDMICSLSRGCVVNGVPETKPGGGVRYRNWRALPYPGSTRCVIEGRVGAGPFLRVDRPGAGAGYDAAAEAGELPRPRGVGPCTFCHVEYAS